MTGSNRPGGSRVEDEALDRAIDEALREALQGGPRQLRARVLARLDEPAAGARSEVATVLRPAMLAVAGVLVIVVGVALSWWRVDNQLGRAASTRRAASTGSVERPRSPGERATTSAAPRTEQGEVHETVAAEVRAAVPAGGGRRDDRGAERVAAAVGPQMDAMSRPKGLAADEVLAGEEEPESFLPGATGGDLGDPIRPIPRPRPIVIAPIVVSPIADAPPISTLATPVSTLSEESSSRDQTGPAKSEGVRQ